MTLRTPLGWDTPFVDADEPLPPVDAADLPDASRADRALALVAKVFVWLMLIATLVVVGIDQIVRWALRGFR